MQLGELLQAWFSLGRGRQIATVLCEVWDSSSVLC